MVCQVMSRKIHIYLIFSSFSSDVTSVIQWDAERQAASFHLKSIRPHAGSEVQASTLWAPLQEIPLQNLSKMGQSQKSCVCRLISVTLGRFILHFVNPGQFSALGLPWASSDLERECQATLKLESKFCYWLLFQGLVLEEGHHCETTSVMNHVTRIMLWCLLTETLLTLAVV